MEKKAKYISLSDYCSSVRDGTHDTPKPTETGKYLVTSRAVNNNTIDFSSCYYISQKDFDKINKRSLVEQWDVIMTMIGSVGRLLLVKDSPDYAIKNMALFKIGDEMRAKWLYYYLSNKSVQDYFEQIANGTSQHFIGLGQLRKLKIADFTPDSVCIASILSSYDNLIELNTRRIKILEQMAENLYKEWFVRFRFPNYQNTPIENGIPKGWKVETLGDFGITLTSGSRPKGGIDTSLQEGIPSLGAEAIKGLAEFDYSSVKLIPEVFYNQMKRGKNTGNDILLYKDGAYIGRTTVFRDGFPFNNYAINEHVFIISPVDIEYKNYLYFTLHQNAYFCLMQNLNRNAAQPGLSNNDINKIKVLFPNKELISEYNQIVEPILKNIFQLAHLSANLTRQRDLLLPRLMSGQLPTQ